jgi:integrase
MTVLHLTDAIVESLVCPTPKKHIEIFDTLLKGLYVDVLSNGRMSYRIRYYENGLKKCTTIGNARVLLVEEARIVGREILRKVAAGINPKKTIKLIQAPTFFKPENLQTLSQFFETKYVPFVKGYKRSWKCDLTLINNHINPILGSMVMANITPADVSKLVYDMHSRRYAVGTCNRVLVLMRYAFSLAMRWCEPGIASNPAKELPNFKQDNKRERFLSQNEADKLMVCVRQSENSMLQFVVPFLIYTGARKREVLDAKWQDIDWQEKSWRIPLTKSGKVRHIPLSESALELLLQLKSSLQGKYKNSNPFLYETYIFPNPKTHKPYVSIFYSWDTARKDAELPDLRIHDLRHSFASFLVNAGRSLYEVQELLGHADIRTTSRYAHLNRERLVGAVSCIPRI